MSADLYIPDRISEDFIAVVNHGFRRSAEDYRRWGEAFALEGAVACLPDMRSHGSSGGSFEISRMSDDMLALAGRLGEGGHQVIEVSHSLSAYITAVALAKDAERSIKAAVLVAPPRNLSKYQGKFPMANLLGKPLLEKITSAPFVHALAIFGIGRTEEGVLRYHDLRIDDPENFLKEIRSSPDIVEMYTNGWRVRAPVLLLTGYNDRIIESSDSAEIARAMRNNSGNGSEIEFTEIELRHHLLKGDIYNMAKIATGFAERHIPRARG